MSISIYENKPYRVYTDDNKSDYGTISTIGVYFITDKQSVFSSYMITEEDNDRTGITTHPGIIRSIDEKIYGDEGLDPETSRRIYNTYICLYKDEHDGNKAFIISLPENGYISKAQYYFLTRALMELKDFNDYQCFPGDKNKYISILIGDKEYDDLSVDEVIEKINNCVIGYQELHQEKIIGDVLTSDELLNVIKYHIALSSCKNLDDLALSMDICKKYYDDSYYHDSFIKLFPDYERALSIFNDMRYLNMSDVKFDNLSFENIYTVLKDSYEDYWKTLGVDKISLRKSVYEYFKWGNNNHAMRGVGVITDSQYIFYTQVLRDDYGTHNDIAINIENAIHPYNKKRGWDAYHDNNIYFYSVGNEFIIDLPENSELSMNQYKYLCMVLDEVDKFNREVSDDKKICIDVHTVVREYFNDSKLLDVEKIKEDLYKMVTQNIEIEDQIIIGKTLSDDDMMKSMLYHIGMKDKMSFEEFRLMMKMCNKYFGCRNTHDMFCSVFPNYDKVKRIFDIVIALDIKIDYFENVSFNSIGDILENNIKKLFNDKLTYRQIISTIYELNCFYRYKEYFNSIFPNLELFLKCNSGMFLSDEEEKSINLLLADAKTYEDKIKIIINFYYEKISKEIFDAEEERKKITKDNEEISVQKNIAANKDKLNDMIRRYNELRASLYGFDISIELTENKVAEKEGNVRNSDNKLKQYSSNFLKRLFYRRKIREIGESINSINAEIESLKTRRESDSTSRQSIADEMSSINGEFKAITEFDVPYGEEFMAYYYETDYSSIEKLHGDILKSCDDTIRELSEKLNLINSSGLVSKEKRTLV